MTDMHTHILPGMDDGSKNVAQSLEMLRLEKTQGVTQVVLTPHFYALADSPERFLNRRRRAYEALQAKLEPGMPQLVLGAEVQYFEGICAAPQVMDLRIQGTRLLLLEMPFCPWTDRMVEDVLELNSRPEIQVVLAHVERYLRWQSPDTLPILLEAGVLTQVNGEFFTHWRTKRKALRMLRMGMLHLLGSDCHDLADRPPQLGKAREQIRNKLGTAAADRLIQQGDALLKRNRAL